MIMSKSNVPPQNAQDPKQAAQPAQPQQGHPAAAPVTPEGQTQPSGAPGQGEVKALAAGDPMPSVPNAESHGQGTTQEDANKAAGGAYRVLYPISHSENGQYRRYETNDIVHLSAEDAKAFLETKAVESADTSGADHKAGSADPRKIQ